MIAQIIRFNFKSRLQIAITVANTVALQMLHVLQFRAPHILASKDYRLLPNRRAPDRVGRATYYETSNEAMCCAASCVTLLLALPHQFSFLTIDLITRRIMQVPCLTVRLVFIRSSPSLFLAMHV